MTRRFRLALVPSLAAALALAAGASAQPVFDAVGRPDGLPSDYVLAAVQDRDGFLWVGTDAGVARWDGAQAVSFTTDDGLPHAYVYALADDGRDLWVGTRRGLARLDREPGAEPGPGGRRFRRVSTPLGPGSVDRLAVDARGRLVVVAPGGVARRARGGRWTVWRGRYAVDAAPLPDGSLLVTTVRPDGTPAYWRIPADAGGRVLRLRIDAALVGRVWPGPRATFAVDGAGGLRRACVVGDRIVADGAAVRTGGSASAVLLARDGSLVFSRIAGGVVRVGRDGRAERLLPWRAEALAEDAEGGLWAGTFGQGAFRLRARHLTTLWPEPTLRLAPAPDGSVWATSGSLLRVARDRVRPSGAAVGLRAVHVDRAGRVRASAETAVAVLAGGALRSAGASDPSWVSGLVAARDTLSVGTYAGGLLRFTLNPDGRIGRALDTLTLGRGLPTEVVEDVLPARGGVWLLTRDAGALRVRGRRAERFGRAEGLPSSAAFSVLERADGSVWVGTDRGVGRVLGGRALALGAADLAGHRVVALFERPGVPGVVWAVADTRLVRIDGADGPAPRLRVVGGFALVADRRASVHAALYDARTDRLLLATSSGLVRADLRALPPGNGPAPRVAVVGVRVDGRGVSPGGTPTRATLAEIMPGRHRVEVDVVALTFSDAARVEVRWDDGPWRMLPGRTVALDNVGAGDHRLAARAVSSSGARSARAATVAFRVRPAWWERRAVQALGALLLAAALAGGGVWAGRRRLRARLAAALAERSAERRVEAERARISRDLHDHVGARLSTLVVEAEAARLEGAGLAGLAAVEAGAHEAMAALRETVWALHGDAVTAGALAERLRRFAAAPAAARGVAVAVCVEGDAGRVLAPDRALHLYRIAQEAVTNALKHAGAATVAVTLAVGESQIALSVTDDGRFREARGDGDPGGDGAPSGFGLRTMAARADALGGRFALDTAGPTTVRVVVPAADEAL